MRKYIINLTLILTVIILFSLIYLSIYGIKTKKFNSLINEQINQFDNKLSLKVNNVFLKLNLRERSIKLDTQNAKIFADNKFLNLSKIDLNINIVNFLRKNNSINNIKILTGETKIKELTSFLNAYKFSLPRLIIYNQIKKGSVEALIDINFKDNLKKNYNISIKGKLTDAKVNVLNNYSFNNIDLDFYIQDNAYSLSNIHFISDGINFKSKNLIINKSNKIYKVSGDIESKKGLINSNYFSKLLNYNLDFIENKKILVDSKNQFNFILNEKRKLKNLNLNSQINFKEIFINKKYQKLVYLKKGTIKSKYSKKELKININSGYSFLNKKYENNEKDNINIDIIKINNKDFKVKAIIKNEDNKINSKELFNYFDIDRNLIKDQEIVFTSENELTFNIDKKKEIKNLKVKSDLNIEELLFRYKFPALRNILNNFDDIIKTNKNIVNLEFYKNKLYINALGSYSLKKEYDNFNFKILKNNKNLNFSSKIEIKNNPITLKDINYKKEKNVFSNIEIEGEYLNDKKVKFNKINYIENNNRILISNLYLSNNFKIIDVETLMLKFINENKNINHLDLSKKENKFIVVSKNFDAKSILENIIDGDSNNKFLNNFKNLNSQIILNLNNLLINEIDYMSKFSGNLNVRKNKIISGEIKSYLNDKNNFSLDIKTNSQKEKITKILIDKPGPFVKNYKFIKGFNDGILSYKSIEKNEVNNANLKIFDFKIKEVPVLAKILTLASFQGIADLLTGEGIRFEEFEMKYESSKNLTTINEMYATGPAMSILMEGYIEKNKLTSLRGTLVPATTLNKYIGKIKILGNILVGKKKGEGVFGVSFKIKGPPNDLKSTVNPIKTLTPRFITRTLDRLKKD